ncbi:hypothetical protein [Aquimarina sp. AU119]|nr:hypothetical protein [Aquimarina sp. AU119]
MYTTKSGDFLELAGILFEETVFGETVWRSNVGIIFRNIGNW